MEKSGIKIWLIQIGEEIPLSDNIRKMRSCLLAEELVRRGHDVLWWASTFSHFKKDWVLENECEIEISKGLRIKTLKGIGYRKNISVSRLVDHRIISWKFRYNTIKMSEPDIIIISMPPHDFAYQAVNYAKRKHIPVVVDIRDPWPDVFLDALPQKFRKIGRILLHKEFGMIYRVMRNADYLVAVTKTLLNWGLAYADREKSVDDMVFYLGYRKPAERKKEMILSYGITKLLGTLKNSFVVTFIGTFSTYHNPSVIIDCAERIKAEQIVFILSGDGDYYETVRKKASKLQNVVFTGWLGQDEIDDVLHHSDIGICPTPKHVALFPNKAFLYLANGLPIISAFQGDLREIIQEEKIGIYYPPGDVGALVKSVNTLYENDKLYIEMSENAQKVFDARFNEVKIYREYADYIERIAADAKKKRADCFQH
jgi:glycosyltransferase involved in cell wall biosynthesis